MSTQTVTVSFDEAQLAVIDEEVDKNGITSREELVITAVDEYLARRYLAQRRKRTGKRELTGQRLEAELKAIKKIRREIWERDYAHLLSGQ